MAAELNEQISEDFGFKLAESKKVFDSPLDLQNSVLQSAPLHLLSVATSIGVFAASNGHSLHIGKLANLDDTIVSGVLENITKVEFSAGSSLLFVLANGNLHSYKTANFNDTFTFAQDPKYTNVATFALSPSDPATFAYIDSTNHTARLVAGEEKQLKLAKSLSWSIDGSLLAYCQENTLSVVDTTGTKVVAETVDLVTIAEIALVHNNQWLLMGYTEDDDDPQYILCSPASNGLSTHTVSLPPPFGDVDRAPTLYAASVTNWVPNSLFTFFAGALATELATIHSPAAGDSQLLSTASDSLRAELPMDDDSGDDSLPVGLAIDLSVVDKTVKEPCLGVDDATGVLPRVLCLNHFGYLVLWYVFDAKALKDGTLDLRRAQSVVSVKSTNEPSKSDSTKPLSGLGSSTSTSNPLAKPLSGFGSGFGSSTSSASGELPAFGSVGFGASKTPNASGFGSTGFGSSGFGSGGSSFGSSGFGSSGFGKSSFGSSGFGTSGFGTSGLSTSQSSGLSAFGKFAGGSSSSSFTAAAGKTDIFGSSLTQSPFGQKKEQASTRPSIFDGESQPEKPKSIFGASFLNDKKDPNTKAPFGASQSSIFAEKLEKLEKLEKPEKLEIQEKPEEKKDSTKPAFSFGSFGKELPSNTKPDDSTNESRGFLLAKQADQEAKSTFGDIFKKKDEGNEGKPDENAQLGKWPSVDKQKESPFGSLFGKDSKKESPFDVLKDNKQPSFSKLGGLGEALDTSTEENQKSTPKIAAPGFVKPEVSDIKEREDKEKKEREERERKQREEREKEEKEKKEKEEKEKAEKEKAEKEAKEKKEREKAEIEKEEILKEEREKEREASDKEKFKKQDWRDFHQQLEVFDGLSKTEQIPSTASLKEQAQARSKEILQSTDGMMKVLENNSKSILELLEALLVEETEDIRLGQLAQFREKVAEKDDGLNETVEKLRSYNGKMENVVGQCEEADALKMEVERILSLMGRFLATSTNSQIKKRPLDIHAEYLQLRLRQKFSQVKQTYEALLEKMIPFGLKKQLQNGMVDKLEEVVFELNTKVRGILDDIDTIDAEIKNLDEQKMIGPIENTIGPRRWVWRPDMEADEVVI